MHLEVARWLESSAGDDVRDRADLLASHAVRALDLAKAAGLRRGDPRARSDRAAIPGDGRRTPDRPGRAQGRRVLRACRRTVALRRGRTSRAPAARDGPGLAFRCDDLGRGRRRLPQRDRPGARPPDAPIVAAQVMRRLYFQLGLQGETSRGARDVLDEAIELLEAQPEPGETLAELYACRSEAEMFAGRSEESLSWASRALELPRSPEITLMALHLRGNARCELGDYGGVDDLREALSLAQESGVGLHIVTSYSYLVERVGSARRARRGTGDEPGRARALRAPGPRASVDVVTHRAAVAAVRCRTVGRDRRGRPSGCAAWSPHTARCRSRPLPARSRRGS